MRKIVSPATTNNTGGPSINSDMQQTKQSLFTGNMLSEYQSPLKRMSNISEAGETHKKTIVIGGLA